jgi:aerobic-type carbon monoxide dehydrogenase small subunit (CoxS/CutS family)
VTEDLSDTAKYLCPYCSATYSGFDTLKTHVLSEHSGEELPQPDGLVNLVINTKKQLVLVQPEWTLYYLLHDKLGLIGSKQFCDRGACGSCTVIMNGRAILSCMALAIECDGRTIETIEGIAEAEHPLIENYAEHHAMQCGYCTPGFVVTAKALLDKNPDPTEDEIREALAGNLCRCGTYPQHPIAVLETVRQIREENIDA